MVLTRLLTKRTSKKFKIVHPVQQAITVLAVVLILQSYVKQDIFVLQEQHPTLIKTWHRCCVQVDFIVNWGLFCQLLALLV
jgi:hypothetical protein